ncbi:MAG: FHA domain-containing protein [Planctomycetota bacterium]|nr:FHA domain-containing protein [Planctomycetota bacterium]
MNVLIRSIDRNAGNHLLTLRNGQRATVGRSATADLAFPHDEEMKDPHLEFVVHRDGCSVQALGTAEVLVNDQVMNSHELQPMDVVVAGRTRLQVEYSPKLDLSAPVAKPEDTADEEAINWPEYLSGLKLAESSMQLAMDYTTLDDVIDGLIENAEFHDAILLRAFQLGPQLAVAWACRCLKEASNLPAPQAHAVNVAEKWCNEPTEELRREAEKVATDLDHSGSGAIVAWACFCCGESVGPAEFESMPPEPYVECCFVRAALIMHAMQFTNFEEQFRSYVLWGKEMRQDPKLRARANELN